MRFYARETSKPAGDSYQAPLEMDCDFLVYTRSGTASYRSPNGEILIGPGTLFQIPAGVRNCDWRVVGGAPWRPMTVMFEMTPQWASWWTYSRLDGGFTRLSLNLGQRIKIQREYRALIAISEMRSPLREPLFINRLEHLILECLLQVSPPDQWIDPRVQATTDFISRHHQTRIDVRRLTEVAGVSATHLARLFQAHYQQTPMRYVEQKRLESARDLLLFSKRNIRDIAQESGFQDPLHFSRRFRTHFGHPPRVYRRKHGQTSLSMP